jgi:prolyl 4-hydroxylase
MSSPSAARQAVALAANGRVAEALETLERAAASGDGEALFARGLWRIDGRLLPRDLTAARADFERAAAAGDLNAARVHAGLLATGLGGIRSWSGALDSLSSAAPRDPVSASQKSLIEAMDLDAAGDPIAVPEPSKLHDEKCLLLFPGLLTARECELLAELAAPRFRPALIFHETQKRFVKDPTRDSDASGFPVVTEWPFVHAINRRIAAASGTDVARGETLQILRYAVGQQFRRHFDAVPGMANQRVMTALIYLNDDYEGGETAFPQLDRSVRGTTGDMLLFGNALEDGSRDPAMSHAGLPVRAGTKLVASRWIRQRPPDDPLIGFGRHEAEGYSAL